MSQGKTFEDFLNWKKGQQSGGSGRSSRRYKDESSSDSDSSHEEVKFSKKKSNSNRYRVDESHSDSSEERSVSRRKKGSSSKGISRRNTMNDRYTSEREDSRRGYNDREDRRYTSEREDNRRGYNDDRRYTSEREDSRRGYNDREETDSIRSRNSKGVDRSSKRDSRRYKEDSSSDEEIIINRKAKSKSSGSINKRLSRRQEYDDSHSSDDDHSSRYRRNVDSSDSEENRKKKSRSANNTIKRSTNRRAKSEHNLNPKRVSKKKTVQNDDSSEEEQYISQRRNTVKSSSSRNISSPPKKKVSSKRQPQQDEESSEENRPTTPKNGNKKSSSKSVSSNETKIENNKTNSSGKHHLVIHQKNFNDENTTSHHSDSQTKKISQSRSKNNNEIRFNHLKWLDEYDQIYNSKDKEAKKKRSMLKDLLDKIEQQTDSVCEGSGYFISDKDSEKLYLLNTHDISSGVKRTQSYAYHHLEKFLPADGVKGTTKTTAHFIKSDILDVGLFIKREIKKNPLVLVSADPRTPGGKDHRCLFGEEISIWRRTAIREYLEEERRSKFFGEGDTDDFVYDIPQNGAVYCPDVPVFRSNPRKGYNFIEPETLSFVVIPPILNPVLVNGRLKEEDAEILRKKLTMIFLTALANNHDAVVVTAFGCGYAQNPPQHVAEIFTEVINKFRNFFANIAFAIIDNANARKNSPEGNIVPFSNVFNTLQKKPNTTTN